MAAENKWRGCLSRYVPVLFWIGVIFYLSGGGGSFSESSRFIRPILEFLFPGADPATISLYHQIVRKLAHPVVYAILGLLSARAFAYSSKPILRSAWYLAAFGLVVIVSVLDELNQSYNPLRTGSAWDVVLDSIGGAMAVLFVYLIMRRRKTVENEVANAAGDA